MTTPDKSSDITDEFDVAKSISEMLKPLDGESRKRVLRWVAERHGITPEIAGVEHMKGVAPVESRDFPAVVPRAGVDIKSFISQKAPKSDNQFAACVAYYYRFEAPPSARRDSITGDILQEAARLSGRRRLGVPRHTLNNAKQAGYLDSAAPGEFAINSVGENLVAMTLPGGSEPTVTARSKKMSRRK